MRHVTCDLCGKSINTGEDHFVVKIEVFAAHDPAEITEADLDEDHMEAISQLLQDQEDTEALRPLEPTTRQYRYDLCPCCRRRYQRDPLSKEQSPKFEFSEN